MYEYACPVCGSFEKEQRISESKLSTCPTCNSPVKRLISQTSFVLKGSGWYSDGYGSSGSGGKRHAQGGSAASGGGCAEGACARCRAGSGLPN